MSPDDLRALVTTMRELAVTKLKTPDLEIELGAAPVAADAVPLKGNGKALSAYLDKMLYAASEGLPIEDEDS